jgi:hypothetical protein
MPMPAEAQEPVASRGGFFMPEVKLSYRIIIELRRLPLIHRPLKWLRRVALKRVTDGLLELSRLLSTPWPRWGPAKATFSILELLRAKVVQGRIVLETQGEQSLPDHSIQVLCGLTQHAEQPRPIFWSHHREARLVGASLGLMDGKKQIAIEAAYGQRFFRNDPAYRHLTLPAPVPLAGNWTSICSHWTPNGGVPTFSHWLLDALPRLAVLDELPTDTRILVPRALAGYQKESLKLLGLSDRIRHTPERHLLVENYYFSSPTTMISCYNPYGVNFLRSRFLPQADPAYSAPKKFIIQRKGKSRGIKNEPEVNNYFRGLGWEIIDTEKLTFAQEIQLFSGAEAIAGILGSGFTNCVWCQPGCKVITFIARSWLDGWVEWICGVAQLDYRYQIFADDHAMMATVQVDEVKKLLRSLGLEAGR